MCYPRVRFIHNTVYTLLDVASVASGNTRAVPCTVHSQSAFRLNGGVGQNIPHPLSRKTSNDLNKLLAPHTR